MREWPDWPQENRSSPWLVAVGSSKEGADWPAHVAARWIDTVADHLAGRAPRHRRAKHLIALPVLGTGRGGQHHQAGDVLNALVPALRERAAARDIDVALVTGQPEDFAAARAVRGTDDTSWPELDIAKLRDAAKLAELAGLGQLVLFLGAGVSVGAGMPDWKRLVRKLAVEARVDPDAAGWSRSGSARPGIDHPASSAPGIFFNSANASPRHFVAPRLPSSIFLMACLPVTEAVTTNYDDLFEASPPAVGKYR